jgi:hypothetical protein
LKIADPLNSLQLITLRILRWCGIALATTIRVTIIVNIGYWSLPRLL